MATTLGISHSRDLKKSEVIEAILEAEGYWITTSVPEEQSAGVEKEIDDNKDVEVRQKDENDGTDIDTDNRRRADHYVDTATVGTIVAFKLPDGKTKSAMITKRSTKNRKFEVQTDYGATYIVTFEDIVWVRTGKRWPKGVYQLLRGEA